MGNSCLFHDSTKTARNSNASSATNGFVSFFKRSSNENVRPTTLHRTLTLRHPEAPTLWRGSAQERLAEQKRIILCWQNVIGPSRRDLFHKTMLYCIQASPKMNEVIACGHYCYRDLTKWPKLNRICQAIFIFFDKLIIEYKLDEDKMYEACVQLGEKHANYAQYGMKPHFMDLFQQNLLGIIARLEMDEKVETCIAFTHLITFVVDVMIEAYSKKAANIRANLR